MITAKEASLITQTSDKIINDLLDGPISVKIEAAAREGKNNIILDWALGHDPRFHVNKQAFYPPTFDPFQTRIKQRLEASGFQICIFESSNKASRVGLGSSGDDFSQEDIDPIEKTYHMQVKW